MIGVRVAAHARGPPKEHGRTARIAKGPVRADGGPAARSWRRFNSPAYPSAGEGKREETATGLEPPASTKRRSQR